MGKVKVPVPQLKGIDLESESKKTESKNLLHSANSSNLKRDASTKNQNMENNISCTGATKAKKGCNFILGKSILQVKIMRISKEGPYRLVKETIQQKEITLVNIHAPNIGTPNPIK